VNLSIRRAEAGADGPVLQALLELYLHDMSEWFQFEINDDGTYGYDMSEYWADDEPVYLAEVEGMPAGFALICTNPAVPERPAGTLEVEEYFVSRQHRHSGLSGEFACGVFDTWPGNWLVRVFNRNAPAMPFWRRTVERYTEGDCVTEPVTTNGNRWTHYHFGPDVRVSR
jgi:predicted acetyltransferase|tara:strand:+ start:1815 stop:2324 length:510 start_codon:yes stop_codon:yes gene_type:complete